MPSLFGADNRSYAVLHVREPALLCMFGRERDTFLVAGCDGTARVCELDAKEANRCREVATATLKP